MNILLNEFGCTVKGGATRDCVVRGEPLQADADIDCEAPATLQQSSWQQTLEEWEDVLTTKYTLSHSQPTARKSFASTGEGIISFKILTGALTSIDIEIVTPWNDGYVPCPNMDFSCNNLKIDPNSEAEIRLCYPIMMTGKDILQQLCAKPKPHTSPTRDCSWTAFDSSRHKTPAEGHNGRMYVEATTEAMEGRLDKFRDKGFFMVEQPHVSRNGKTVTLMHGTDTAAGTTILQSGFKPSTSGNFGPGVYMSRSMGVVRAWASPVILQADVFCPNLFIHSKSTNPDRKADWRNNGQYDAMLLPAQHSWRNLEEWVICDPSNIANIKQICP